MKFFNDINYKEMILFSFYIELSFMTSFWIFNGFYLYIQNSNNDFWEKYRIQKNKPKMNFENNPKKFSHILELTKKYQITSIIFLPFLYLIFRTKGTIHISPFEFPDLFTASFQLIFIVLLEDVNYF
jgi:uncharacterized protein with PQ loop repeat